MKKIIETNCGRAIYSDCFERHGLPPMTPVEYVLAWLRAPRHFGVNNVYSDEWTKIRAGRHVAPYIYGGKARVLKWDFASLAAGALGDILVCGKIRQGDMIVMGREFHSALSADTAASTGSYGTYTIQADGLTPLAVDDVDRYLTATDLDVAGENALASLQASPQGVGTGPLHVATADLLLALTNSVEVFATAGRVSGWMLVVRD